MSTRRNLFLVSVLGALALSGTPGAAAQHVSGGVTTKPVAAAGTVKLAIKPKGNAKKKLKKKGKAKVKPTVTYTPTGGTAATQRESVKLKKKRKR